MNLRMSLATVLALALTGCGGTNPAGPTTAPQSSSSPTTRLTLPTAKLTGTMTVSSALTAAGGYQYTIQIQLAESAGVSAKITAVDINKIDFWGPYQPFVTFGEEAWSGSNTIPAHGTLTSKPLVATVEFPDDYYYRLGATIEFSETNSLPGSIALDAETPPMPEPPPSSTFALVGIARDAGNPVRDVTVTVLDGANAGRTTQTDATGKYHLTGLKSGTFSVGWAKSGFKPYSYTVDLKSNLTVNLLMERE